MKEPNALTQVAEFHKLFEHPILPLPGIPKDRIELRYNLLHEEVEEFLEAARAGDIVGVADALADIQYVLSGAILEFGLHHKFADIFAEVQRSNMSKACSSFEEAQQTVDAVAPLVCNIVERDGKWFVYRGFDRKTIKSINYTPVNIKKILESNKQDQWN